MIAVEVEMRAVRVRLDMPIQHLDECASPNRGRIDLREGQRFRRSGVDHAAARASRG